MDTITTGKGYTRGDHPDIDKGMDQMADYIASLAPTARGYEFLSFNRDETPDVKKLEIVLKSVYLQWVLAMAKLNPEYASKPSELILTFHPEIAGDPVLGPLFHIKDDEKDPGSEDGAAA